MKIFDIALKDLKHIFKSPFALVMMFGAPLLITGLLYFAFGGLGGGKNEYNLPLTRVWVVNLDQPDAATNGFAAGDMLVEFLQDEALTNLIAVSLASDEASARQAVDQQRAGVALIIPPNFTAAALLPDQAAAVTLYQDPTLTIGPSILKDLVSHFMDGFSGTKIAAQVTAAGLRTNSEGIDPTLEAAASQLYTAWLRSSGHNAGNEDLPRLSIVSPSGEAQEELQGVMRFGPIMAGMLVFFVFFMGANGAESILREDEQGTLSRLFVTPTQLAQILGGKFLAVILSLWIQVSVLLLASHVLFDIDWGLAATVILVASGFIVASAGMGILLMSFIKNSRQTGPVMSGVLTLTGMLGGLFTNGIPNLPASFDQATLVTPQGWALKAWKLALAGAEPEQVLLPALVLLGLGLVFLSMGIALFRKRFA